MVEPVLGIMRFRFVQIETKAVQRWAELLPYSDKSIQPRRNVLNFTYKRAGVG